MVGATTMIEPWQLRYFVYGMIYGLVIVVAAFAGYWMEQSVKDDWD